MVYQNSTHYHYFRRLSDIYPHSPFLLVPFGIIGQKFPDVQAAGNKFARILVHTTQNIFKFLVVCPGREAVDLASNRIEIVGSLGIVSLTGKQKMKFIFNRLRTKRTKSFIYILNSFDSACLYHQFVVGESKFCYIYSDMQVFDI